jgi:hypothetical protein
MQNTNNHPSKVEVLNRLCLPQEPVMRGGSTLPLPLALSCVYCLYERDAVSSSLTYSSAAKISRLSNLPRVRKDILS